MRLCALLLAWLAFQNSASAESLTISCESKALSVSAMVASFNNQAVEAQKVSAEISVREKATQKVILKKSMQVHLLSWPQGTELFDGKTPKKSKALKLGVSSGIRIGAGFVRDGSKTVFKAHERSCSLSTAPQ